MIYIENDEIQQFDLTKHDPNIVIHDIGGKLLIWYRLSLYVKAWAQYLQQHLYSVDLTFS